MAKKDEKPRKLSWRETEMLDESRRIRSDGLTSKVRASDQLRGSDMLRPRRAAVQQDQPSLQAQQPQPESYQPPKKAPPSPPPPPVGVFAKPGIPAEERGAVFGPRSNPPPPPAPPYSLPKREKQHVRISLGR